MINKQPRVKKLLQLISYVKRYGNCTDIKKTLKLIYFADRFHLRHYGYLMSNTKYSAMKQGSVSSEIYDILKKEFSYHSSLMNERDLIEKSIQKINNSSYEIIDFQEDLLSKSDKKAINFSIENFNKFNADDLSEITHAYPEWDKYETKINDETKSFQMDIGDFFEEPNNIKKETILKKYFEGKDPFQEDKDFLNCLKIEFKKEFCIF